MSLKKTNDATKEIQLNPYFVPEELWSLVLSYLVDSGESISSTSVVSKQFNNIIITDKDLKRRLDLFVKARNLFVPPINNNRIKIAVTGRDGSGKSSLVAKFLGDDYKFPKYIYRDIFTSDEFQTQIDVDGNKYTLDVIDMVHPDEYNSYESSYYREAHAIIGVYTITDYDGSTNMLDAYLDAARNCKKQKSYPLIVVGNMNDLESERKVSQKEGQELAKKYEAEWIETNYHDLKTINNIFMTLVRTVITANKPRLQSKQVLKPKRSCIVS